MYNDKKRIFTKNANVVLAISFRTKYRFKTHIFTYCRRNRNNIGSINIFNIETNETPSIWSIYDEPRHRFIESVHFIVILCIHSSLLVLWCQQIYIGIIYAIRSQQKLKIWRIFFTTRWGQILRTSRVWLQCNVG